MTRRGLILGLAWGVGLLVGLGIAWAGSQPGKSWIDAPLGDVVLKVGEALDITAHATDPAGVDDIALLVDGETVDVRSVGGGTLEYARLRWTPSAPGTFGLSVWGRSPTGGMSLIPGTLTVLVEADTTTTTAAPSTTTTQAGTTTTAGCDPTLVAPTLVSPAHGSTTDASSVTLHWSYPGSHCTPTQFEVEVIHGGGTIQQFSGGMSTTVQIGECNPFVPQVQFDWRVRVSNPGTGSYSAVWRFSQACS